MTPGLINTFWGALLVACVGVVLIRIGRVAIRRSSELYREMLRRDPEATITFDLLIAALTRRTSNPVVLAIVLWLMGWTLAIVGFLQFFSIGCSGGR